jgi:small subunit ribosomal protein S20
MPHHKSAVKRLKTAEVARQRNAGVKSQVRRQLKRQRTLTGAEAATALPTTHGELDRAASKGVIPKRRAARLKSRTAKKANRAK